MQLVPGAEAAQWMATEDALAKFEAEMTRLEFPARR